jgi:transcriptional regulator with XRE-family HTH domain
VFYDVYYLLCKNKGVSPTRAALEIGLSKSHPTAWKKRGITPNSDTLKKVANYFGVSVDYLLGDDQKEKAAIDMVDDGLKEYLDELRNRPEQRMLFSVTKNATKAQIEAIVKMVEEMQKNK